MGSYWRWIAATVLALWPVMGWAEWREGMARAGSSGSNSAARTPALSVQPLPPDPQHRDELSAGVEPVVLETLDQAWHQALAVDQHLMAGAAEVEAARRAVQAASADRLPQAGLSGQYTVRDNEPAFRINSPFVPFGFTNPYMQAEDFAFEGRVEMPVYTGGRVTHAIDAARSDVRANEYQLQRYQLELKLHVSELYVAVLRAEQEMAVATSHQRSLEAHCRDVELLHGQGRVPRSDMLAAQVAVSDARHQVIKAGSQLDASRAAYNRALGRPLTMPVRLAALEVRDQQHDVQQLTDEALFHRPELAELDARAAQLRHHGEAAAAENRAQVHVQGAYTFRENRFQTPQGITSAGVGVWWNLYDGGRARNRADRQFQLAQAMCHARGDLQSNIQLEVRRAWLAVNETRQRLAVTHQSIQRAEENVRVTRQRYSSDMATNTDVLSAETLRVQTYRNHNNAVYDAALADLRLRRATGRL